MITVTPSTVQTAKDQVWEFLKVFLFLFLVLSVGFAAAFQNGLKLDRIDLETKERHLVDLGKNSIIHDFHMVYTDVRILGQSTLIADFLDSGTDHDANHVRKSFVSFGEKRGLYDQIRLFNESGKELIRVNFNDGKAEVVPEDQLQDKSDRYYFKHSIAADQGTVFISPMDLNIEHGEIEKPFKPIIRFGIPVYDSGNNKKGVLVINYLGSILLSRLKEALAQSIGDPMLLNSEGYWLQGPRAEDEWGFMHNKMKRNFSTQYPEYWERMKNSEKGQFRSRGVLVTFSTLYPLRQIGGAIPGAKAALAVGGPDYAWKILTLETAAKEARFLEGRNDLLWNFYLSVLLLAVILSWVVGRARYQRRESDFKLQRREKRLNAIVNNMAEGLLVLNSKAMIENFNPTGEKMFGYAPGEAIGQDVDILFPGAHHVFHQPFDKNEKFQRIEVLARHKDGSRFPAELAYNRMVMGEKAYYIGMVHDITERRQTESRLRVAKEEAELASRTKSEFLANMSHELRTPLNAVIGFSDIMSRQLFGPIDKKYMEYAQDINISGTHLLELINDILDVSQIEAGKLKLNEEEMEILDIVDSSIRLVSERAEKSHIKLIKKIPKDLCCLYADPRRAKQVLLNVLSNAIKFTPEGGTISISGEWEKDGSISVYVTDTGIGIAPENIPLVLQPFGQIDNAFSRSTQGTGLGLPLSVNLMELHGGSLTIISETGLGTTVCLMFPAERVRCREKARAPA
ncbi:MAG: ATP-binding protein [Rhodospirillales bacterium]|nr:ATP-binding protein [Rhodospirillales bacterium]